MPVDFRKLADAAKEKHEAAKQERVASDAAERAVRHAQIDEDVALLESSLVPILRRAANELRTTEIDARVATNYDVKNYVDRAPTVHFYFRGPVVPGDTYVFETRKVEFRIKNAKLQAIAEKATAQGGVERNLGAVAPADAEQLVSRAVELSLEHYYQQHAHWEQTASIRRRR